MIRWDPNFSESDPLKPLRLTAEQRSRPTGRAIDDAAAYMNGKKDRRRV